MKRALLLCLLIAGPTFGQTPGAPMPASLPPSPPRLDPAIQALGQMEQEAHVREAQALVRAYAAEAQVANLIAQIAAEKKRSDEAQAKLADQAKP